MISGSSVWTDGSSGDRSSRRALILQMAKARMKSGGKSSGSTVHSVDKTTAPIAEEGSLDTREPRSRPESRTEMNTDIDFSGELD